MGGNARWGSPRWKIRSFNALCLEVLNAIYEEDFLGFSYGFRPGRGQHDALDALAVGITRTKVNWIVDANIARFFDAVSHEWLMRFVEHRIGDRRMNRLVRKWLKAGVMEEGRLVSAEAGTPPRGGRLATAGKYLPPLRLRSLGRPVGMDRSTCKGVVASTPNPSSLAERTLRRAAADRRNRLCRIGTRSFLGGTARPVATRPSTHVSSSPASARGYQSFPLIPCAIRPRHSCSTSAEPTCATSRPSWAVRASQHSPATRTSIPSGCAARASSGSLNLHYGTAWISQITATRFNKAVPAGPKVFMRSLIVVPMTASHA